MKYFLLIIALPVLFTCKQESKSNNSGRESIDTAEISISEKVTIKGMVLSQQDSSPISGAFIMIPGSSIGTMTDNTGNFMIEHPESEKYILTFSAQQGFESLKTEVNAGRDNRIYLIPKSE